jgi:hypothetical protein
LDFLLAEISEIPVKWRRDLTLKRLSATTDEPATPILSGKFDHFFDYYYYYELLS